MPETPLYRHVLPNGLRVVLAPDRSAPIVGVCVDYDVGFRSEPQGRTGFAHLFEHLMFQGSESLEKLAHARHVMGAGGTFNGSTRPDHTDYHQVLPASSLELALFCEADRMRAPRLTEENLRNQVNVVEEEIRLNVLNRPYGGFPWLLLPPVLYRTFPNAHNGYGDFADLEQATVEDCAAFFDTYYAPGNAVLTIAGDIDVDEAADLVHRHFGDVPAREVPDRAVLAEPGPERERRDRHVDAYAPLPAIAIGYRLPDPATDLRGYTANVVLAGLLADGDSARLRQRLVVRDAVATKVDAECGLFGAYGARDPDTFICTVTHGRDTDADRVIAAVDDELARLAAAGPDAGELARVAARCASRLHATRDDPAEQVRALGSFELLHGRAELVAELPELVGTVTAAEVAAAAAALRPDARAVVLVEPAAESRAAAARGGAHRSAAEIGTTSLGPRPLPAAPGSGRSAPRPADSVDTVLDNGLRVIAVNRPSVPMVELRLRVPFAGTGQAHPAAAELLAETLLCGTGRRDRVAVDADLARVGGELHVGRDVEWLHIVGRGLASGFDTLLDVLADSVVGAEFPSAVVVQERKRLADRVAFDRAQPSMFAREALRRHRFGDHPFARELPLESEVAAVLPEAVQALHRRAVLPAGSVAVIVGAVDAEQAVAALAAAFKDWHGRGAADAVPPVPELRGGDLLLVDRQAATQAQIRLCAPAVPRADARYPALILANAVFGGYFSSRLMENLREDKGYTYGARSHFEPVLDGMTLLVQTDTASDVTAPALKETRRELARLVDDPPSAAEVDAACRYTLGSLLIATAAQSTFATQLSDLAAVGLGLEWLAGFQEQLPAVTVDAVAQAAREFFAPAAFTGVVVGDAERLTEPLQAIGGVRV